MRPSGVYFDLLDTGSWEQQGIKKSRKHKVYSTYQQYLLLKWSQLLNVKPFEMKYDNFFSGGSL